MTVETALRQGAELLARAGIPAARLTAEVLLCHALRTERIRLYSHPEHELSTVEWIHYGRYLHQRLLHCPTQYITCRQEFYGREFLISPAVLIPRPETEQLVEHAMRVAPGARRIADLGTGSGILAITLALELKTASLATDLSLPALLQARENARRLGAPVQFVQCDWASALRGPFDLIVSNPPYVEDAEWGMLPAEVREYEPALALRGGEQTYRRILAGSAPLLEPGGWLLCEIGAGQAHFTTLAGPDWSVVQVFEDLAARPRVLALQKA